MSDFNFIISIYTTKDHFKLKLLTKYKNDPNDWLMEEIARLNDTYHQEKQEHSDEIEDILASQIKRDGHRIGVCTFFRRLC